MNAKSLRSSWASLLTGCVLLLCAGSCAESKEPNVTTKAFAADPQPAGATSGTGEGEAEAPIAKNADPLADAPIEAYQRKLLELAFKSACALPVDPQIKNRSRSQQAVVEACLELDQTALALRYLDQIENWRKGLCYAQLALHCVNTGRTREVEHFLKLASRIADDHMRELNSQAWRRDRVRARIAQTWAALGQEDKLAEFNGLEDSEAGWVESARVLRMTDEEVDAWVAGFEDRIHTSTLDRIRAALATMADLYPRFADDEERREALEKSIAVAYGKVPAQVAVEALLDMADAAAEVDRTSAAQDLTAEARRIFEGVQWNPRDAVSLRAEVAKRFARAGDIEEAKTLLEAALVLFEQEREAIENFERGGALRPIAEAWVLLGEQAMAQSLYLRTVQEGGVNPNLRPRVDDLTGTACSMAIYGCELTDPVWNEMSRISNEL
ncbi:MAG: hypothetical protein RL885_03865 [Planctomycetota bacterium]